MKQRLKTAACRIAGLEPAIVILTAPLLAFPTLRPAWTAGALAALVLVWLVRWIGASRPGARTPMDSSLLLFALTIPVAVWASAFPELTIPKLTGLILGLAAFRATVNVAHSHRNLKSAVALFLLLGLGLTFIGLLGALWARKVPILQSFLPHVPRLIHDLPGAEHGIHPNELGGTIILFLPVSLAAVWGWNNKRDRLTLAWRFASLFLGLILAAVLILSQSRSAWFGAIAGLGAMAWIRWKRARWLILCAMLPFILWLLWNAPQMATERFVPTVEPASKDMVLDAQSLGERSDPWNRAVDAIQTFPLTGSGLGTFRQIAHRFGPVPLPKPDPDIAHAHNVFLQVALDLGIPGLLAYVAMVGITLWLCWRVVHSESNPFRWMALGIIGSLVAFHTFGLADTITLGAKPGLAFWMLLALAVMVRRFSQEQGQDQTDIDMVGIPTLQA